MMAWDVCPYLAMVDIRKPLLFRRKAFSTEQDAKRYIQEVLKEDSKKKRHVHLVIKNVINGRGILDERCDEA